MNTIVLGLVASFTIFAWFIVICLFWQYIQDRRHPKVQGNKILGLVTGITETDDGIQIKGLLNEEGKRLFGNGRGGFLSQGFAIESSAIEVEPMDKERIIKETQVQSVLLVPEPRPYGGATHRRNRKTESKPSVIDYVGTQPENNID